MNCELSHTTVHGYLDGELDAVRSAEFERHIESCAECQLVLERMESLRAQAALTRFGIADEVGPQRIFHSVDAAIKALGPEQPQQHDDLQ